MEKVMLVVYLLLTVKWSISGADVIEGNKGKECIRTLRMQLYGNKK